MARWHHLIGRRAFPLGLPRKMVSVRPLIKIEYGRTQEFIEAYSRAQCIWFSNFCSQLKTVRRSAESWKHQNNGIQRRLLPCSQCRLLPLTPLWMMQRCCRCEPANFKCGENYRVIFLCHSTCASSCNHSTCCRSELISGSRLTFRLVFGLPS